MKKLILFLTILLLLTAPAHAKDKPAILFNKNPITKDTIYNCEKNFNTGRRIYYVILMPKKVESRYLYIQVIKKDNDYGELGYNLIWTRDIRLKDEEINSFTDYFVINEKGLYLMKVFSKDNPRRTYAASEFYVQ